MSVDRGITSGTCEVLVLSVRDVEVGLGVTVFLGQTEVDDIHLIATLANTHEEVVGLNVAVNEGLGMNILDAGDELIGEEQDRLEGKLAVAKVEEILQTGAEKIQDHGIVVTFGTEPSDEGNPDTAGERLIDTSLILELRMLGLDRFELDGNFFARNDVGAQVNITEGTGTDLAADAVLVTNAEIL